MDNLTREEQEYIVRNRIGGDGTIFVIVGPRYRYYAVRDEDQRGLRFTDVTWLIDLINGGPVHGEDFVSVIGIQDSINGAFGNRTDLKFRLPD